MSRTSTAVPFLIATIGGLLSADRGSAEPLKAGIIGLDSSHCVVFTTILHDPKATAPLTGVRVVAAFPGGSADIPGSKDKVAEYTKVLRDTHKVEIVDSVDALIAKVDVVFIESNDGRPHYEDALKVLRAKKPLFIDKPVAGSLADTVAIFALAEKLKVPCFSSSALRFTPKIAEAAKSPTFGGVLGCIAYSPCDLEEHHPDLYWYGIHGVETLFTVMGPGCKSVVRTSTKDADVVTGTWEDGRVGTFRGIRAGKKDFGALVFGAKAIGPTGGFGGYEPLVKEICTFFKTGVPPVKAAETLEIYAFMDAADESKRKKGVPVALADVLAEAKREAAKKLALLDDRK